jgi:hypothetical protein
MDWMKRRHPDAKFAKMIYKDSENFGVFQVYGSWEECDDDKYFEELPNTQGFRNEFRGKVEQLFKMKLGKLPEWVFKPLKEEVLSEGYEKTVLNILKDNGIDGCYFEDGTLFCPCDDDCEYAEKILKANPEVHKLPKIVVQK